MSGADVTSAPTLVVFKIGLISFDVHRCHVCTAIYKASYVPDRIKPSFVIFDIRAR